MSTPDRSGNGRDFSVKEILTDFVLPRLDSIGAKLDSKADTTLVEAMRTRLELVEKTTVSRDEKHKMENNVAARFLLLENDVRLLKEGRAASAFLRETWRFWVMAAVVVAAALITVYLR